MRITFLSRIIWGMLFSRICIPTQTHMNIWAEMNRTANITKYQERNSEYSRCLQTTLKQLKKEIFALWSLFWSVYLLCLPAGPQGFFFSLLPDLMQLRTAMWRMHLIRTTKPRPRDCATESGTDHPMFQYWLALAYIRFVPIYNIKEMD